jgi:dTDP-4-dehydrorhamnose 3,5-epimerase
MIFTETKINGVYIIESEPMRDYRGYFARTFCREEFIKRGLNPEISQCNKSYNRKKGTLRGLHFQKPPFQESKFVQCIRGNIFDVALDIREKSLTFGQWFGATLSEDNNRGLFIPGGCAHGYLTLEENCIVVYQVSVPYHPESEEGIRWDDPTFNIDWPDKILVISQKDQNYPIFEKQNQCDENKTE